MAIGGPHTITHAQVLARPSDHRAPDVDLLQQGEVAAISLTMGMALAWLTRDTVS